MNLLIMGAPGAGKGSMSNLIVEKYEVVHISTGDMLRNAIKEETPVGKKAKEYMDQGNLVPDSIIHDLIIERLSKKDIEKGFLLDGYPRTLAQAIDLSDILSSLNKKVDAVINLNVDEEILLKRITGRRSCPNCKEIYNIYYKPSKVEGVCDKCSSKLVLRKDDNAESLKIRLGEYHKNAQPILEYYKKMDIVNEIDASKTTKESMELIDKVLEGLK